MNYIIRKAKIEDAKEINNLLTLLIQDEKKYDSNINESCVVKRLYEDLIPNESNIVLVSVVDNKIVGYLFGYIENTGDTYKEGISKLEALYILEDYRHNGIATSLIKEFKEWSLNNNIRHIEVQVLDNNIDAVKLYNKEGFKNFKSTLLNVIK